jgi:peptidoglycan hydrolase-like amidase
MCLIALLVLMATPLQAAGSLKTRFNGSTDYLSEQFQTNGDFSGVIVQYNQEASADDYIDFKIRFNEGDDWSEWVGIRPDEDHIHQQENELNEFLINTNRSSGYQLYVGIDAGIDFIKPELQIKKLTFIDAKAGAPSSQVGGFLIDKSPNVISRSEWGADESLSYGSALDVTDENDEDIDRVEYRANGKELKWPRQYVDEVKMLAVHHSASVSDLDDPKQAIRNIHYYHSVRRGWGDIGYNYIIDTEGKIYEGRAGGEKVVGGHSVAINKASIGIAVLGNYETQDVPKDVIQGLVNILSDKADRYNLDVTDDVRYKNKTYPVLGGHSDSAATVCPGANLYQALPTIKFLVSGAEIYEDRSKLSRWRYAYVDQDPLKDMLDLELGEKKTINIKLENVGKNSWTKGSYLKVNNYDDIKNEVGLSGPKVDTITSTVKTGEKIELSFDVTGGLGTGFHGLELSLVMNGTTQTDLPIYVPIYLDNDFSFGISGSDKFTLNLNAGQTEKISVKFKNLSSLNWNDIYDVELSPSNGSSSQLVQDGDVFGSMNIGKFKTVNIDVKAPSQKGTYTEYLVPNIDGKYFFNGPPLELIVKVGNGSSTSSTNSTSVRTTKKINKPLVLNSKVDISNKSKKIHTFELVNATNSTWKKSNFTITKIGHKSVDITNVTLVESSVGPGDVGTIRMELTSSNSGTYKYQFRFFNGKTMVYKTPYRLTVTSLGSSSASKSAPKTITNKTETTKIIPTVQASAPIVQKSSKEPQTKSNNLGPDIRILLSVFDLNKTEITPHGLTEVYVDNIKVATINIRNSVEVREYGSKKINLDIDGVSKTGEKIRFVPVSQLGTITITDLQNRPAWKPSINDNRYRGAIEFQMDTGDLIAINELPIELYLLGVGEVSNSTHTETIKTILIAARSYAYHYVTDGTKFAGKPYNLDDSPARSQKYIGYGFEQRSPNVKKAINETTGKVVTYNDEVIKVPYFSRSNGQTKSAKDVWGWTNTPYLESVSDPYCKGQSPAGHGVGISGCGTDGMAKAGSEHEDIIKYFLKGVELDSIY